MNSDPENEGVDFSDLDWANPLSAQCGIRTVITTELEDRSKAIRAMRPKERTNVR